MATINVIERGETKQLEYDIKADGAMFSELAQLEAIRDAAVVTADGVLRLTTYGSEWLRWGGKCGNGFEVYPLPKGHCVNPDELETAVFYIKLYGEALPMEIERLQATAAEIEKLKRESEELGIAPWLGVRGVVTMDNHEMDGI